MVVNAAAMHPDQRTAARAIGINYGTFKSRLALAHDRGLDATGRTDLNSVRPYWYDAVAHRVA